MKRKVVKTATAEQIRKALHEVCKESDVNIFFEAMIGSGVLDRLGMLPQKPKQIKWCKKADINLPRKARKKSS
jgi:hypothetical protein